MNARPLLCLFTLLWFVSDGYGQSEQATASPAAPSAETAPEPADPPQPPGPALELTPELENAVVNVRVSVGSLLASEQTGAILRADAFTPPIPAQSRHRFVAVLLPSLDEKTLQSSRCVFHVLRTKLDDKNEKHVVQFTGKLRHFNVLTHAAIVQYTEDSPCWTEEEMAVGVETDELWVLQSIHRTQVPPSPPPEMQLTRIQKKKEPAYQPPYRTTLLPGRLEASLHAARFKDGGLHVAASAGETGHSLTPALVLSSAGRLVGFACRMLGQPNWEYQAITVPPVADDPGLSYVPQSVQLSRTSSTRYQILLSGDLTDPLMESHTCRLAVQDVPTADFVPASYPEDDQPAIADGGQYTQCTLAPDGTLTAGVKLPQSVPTGHQLMQVQLLDAGGKVVFHAAPFLVTRGSYRPGPYLSVKGVVLTEAKPVRMLRPPAPIVPQHFDSGFPGRGFPPGTVPQVSSHPPAVKFPAHHSVPPAMDASLSSDRGLPAPSALHVPPVVKSVTRQVTTESRILFGQSIAEGRELLLKLEAAPFWQRLSLADGRWLPLPNVDLASCHIAGNKDALFVLDPAAGRILRYHASTLALEGSAMLPAGLSYHGMVAGCLSDDAPLAIMSSRGALPCDPRTLVVAPYASRSRKNACPLEDQYYYQASGDGMLVWCRPRTPGESSRAPVFRYRDALNGFLWEMLDFENPDPHTGTHPTVAASCPWDRDHGIRPPGSGPGRVHDQLWIRPGCDALGALTTSPVLYSLGLQDPASAAPSQCTFHSYFSEAPWATVVVPEAGDVPREQWASFSDRLWLDPASLTFAVWHQDQALTLHTMDSAQIPPPPVPVLLNYPDCHVPRGSGFAFTPHTLGDAPVKVTCTDTPAGFTVTPDGRMEWQAPPMAVVTDVSFGVKLTGGGSMQSPGEFRVRLKLGGEQPVVAVAVPLEEMAKLKNKSPRPPPGAGGFVQSDPYWELIKHDADSLAAATRLGSAVALPSRCYHSEVPIETVLPGLDNFLALKLENKTLALFSVDDWHVAGSLPLPETSAAFMGGDAVYRYDSTTRTLTRHWLPGFAVTHSYQMPGNARLVALGVAESSFGPVTLVLEEENHGRLLILDKQKLKAVNWAACTPPKDPATGTFQFTSLLGNELPVQLPASKDGQLVSLPEGVLAISQMVTTAFIPPSMDQPTSGNGLLHQETAAPRIDRVFTSGLGYPASPTGPTGPNPLMGPYGTVVSHGGDCYSFPRTDGINGQILLYSTDDDRLLLHLNNVELLNIPEPLPAIAKRRQVVPMGEKNMVTALSSDGTVMQVIALDLPTTARTLNPGSAYVTSHPYPFVAEGKTLEYQLTFNNPAAVEGFALRDKIPGASISSTGFFMYSPPAKIDQSMQINIALQIRLKNGQHIQHRFPIYILTAPPTVAKAE